jgi:hypothetical protein
VFAATKRKPPPLVVMAYVLAVPTVRGYKNFGTWVEEAANAASKR